MALSKEAMPSVPCSTLSAESCLCVKLVSAVLAVGIARNVGSLILLLLDEASSLLETAGTLTSPAAGAQETSGEYRDCGSASKI